MTEFFENDFADFSNVVQAKKKKNQDFIQPLVAFPISNILYSPFEVPWY